MSPRHCDLHAELLRILGAQTHGAASPLNCDRGLAKASLGQGAEMPCPRKIRIEHEGPINERIAVFKLADDDDEREACGTQRDRVIPSKIGGSPRKLHGFSDLLSVVAYPAEAYPLKVTPRRHSVG